MDLALFNEKTYLENKLAQLQRDGENYSTTNQVLQSIQNAGMTAAEHYTRYGDDEGINPNAHFNKVEYLRAKAVQLNRIKADGKTDWNEETTAKAIKAAGMSTAEHCAVYGWTENINPSNSFDVSTYLNDKLMLVHTQPGMDANGLLWSKYTLGNLSASFTAAGLDPLGHYTLYGYKEGLVVKNVPVAEQVPVDQSQPKAPLLSADGKTITVHLQSPLKPASVEQEDFSVVLNGVTLTVDKVAAGADKNTYDVIITLADTSRVPGLLSGETSNLHVLYDPNGGSKSVLETADGPVGAFNNVVTNQSSCFRVQERVTEISTPNPDPDKPAMITKTLHLTVTPPPGYVQPADVAQWVKVDLAATAGVVSGGDFGIATPPRLMDGKLVQVLDASAVDAGVRLNIITGGDGHTIITGAAADNITLGGGADVVKYGNLASSQLSHMDSISGFTLGTDKVAVGSGADKLSTVIDKGPLSLEGVITVEAIQAVLGDTKMASGTAYLVQSGKDYILVADADSDGVFTSADFAVGLMGLTGLTADNASSILA